MVGVPRALVADELVASQGEALAVRPGVPQLLQVVRGVVPLRDQEEERQGGVWGVLSLQEEASIGARQRRTPPPLLGLKVDQVCVPEFPH